MSETDSEFVKEVRNWFDVWKEDKGFRLHQGVVYAMQACDRIEQLENSSCPSWNSTGMICNEAEDYKRLEEKVEQLERCIKEMQRLDKMLIQTKIEQHRWIPVSERLPEGMGDYLVSNGIWIERIWFDNGWCYQKGAEFQDKSKITHWKPIILPEQAIAKAEELIKPESKVRENDMKSELPKVRELVKAKDKWFDSEEGKKCCVGEAYGQYLRNRCELAFIAGWDAFEQALKDQQ